MIKQILPESYKKFKIEYNQSNNIDITEVKYESDDDISFWYKKKNRIQNLFKNLQKDPRSIFYSIGNLSRSILNKVFLNFYNQLEDKNFYQNNNLPLVTLCVNKRSNIDHSILYSISKPFDLLHVDIADIRFFAKSAVDPKYCLLIVNLFSSKWG